MRYCVESSPASVNPAAFFSENAITVRLPETTVLAWATTEQVSIHGEQVLADGEKLAILVEKDFVCLTGRDDEDESDMLEIASFAKRLKLDTLNLSLLRTEKYSPLNVLIAKRRGYYAGKDNIVCSEEYPLERLKDIRRRIRRNYYTLPTNWRIAKKIFTACLIDFHILAKLIAVLFLRQTSNNKKVKI